MTETLTHCRCKAAFEYPTIEYAVCRVCATAYRREGARLIPITDPELIKVLKMLAYRTGKYSKALEREESIRVRVRSAIRLIERAEQRAEFDWPAWLPSIVDTLKGKAHDPEPTA